LGAALRESLGLAGRGGSAILMSMSSARRLPLSFAGDDLGAIGLWIGLRRGSGEDDVNGGGGSVKVVGKLGAVAVRGLGRPLVK
jgi:hypothetical protein